MVFTLHEDVCYNLIKGDDDVVHARTGGQAVTVQATKSAVIVAH